MSFYHFRQSAALLLLLAACTASPPPAGAPATAQVTRALFAARPQAFFDAAEAACRGPGQRAVRPDGDTMACESLPSPEAAASLILTYEGSLQDLPVYVVRFAGTAVPEGYVIAADSFIRVPRENGATVEIRPEDTALARGFAELLGRAGGRVLP